MGLDSRCHLWSARVVIPSIMFHIVTCSLHQMSGVTLTRYIGQSSDANQFLDRYVTVWGIVLHIKFMKLSIYACSNRHRASHPQACQLQVGSNVPEAVEQSLGSHTVATICGYHRLQRFQTSNHKQESMSRKRFSLEERIWCSRGTVSNTIKQRISIDRINKAPQITRQWVLHQSKSKLAENQYPAGICSCLLMQDEEITQAGHKLVMLWWFRWLHTVRSTFLYSFDQHYMYT